MYIRCRREIRGIIRDALSPPHEPSDKKKKNEIIGFGDNILYYFSFVSNIFFFLYSNDVLIESRK